MKKMIIDTRCNMCEMIKIIISDASAFGIVDEAYTDKVIITPSCISYEYKPHPKRRQETNIYRKWTYKTTSPIFLELYKRIAEMTPKYLVSEKEMYVLDGYETTITATFQDKHKESAAFYYSSDYFQDYFSLIKEMVPNTEYIPAVLLTREDYE